MPRVRFHRNISRRCLGWDYSNPGWYFVTIRVRHSTLNLSNINQGVVCLSRIGKIIDEEWKITPEIRRGKVAIDQYVIMPDHMHGILIIEDSIPVATPRRGVTTQWHNRPEYTIPVGAPRRGIEPIGTAPVGAPRRGAPTGGNAKMNWTPGCLGAIICQFKSKCTKRIRAEGFGDFSWQPRYYDRIIRSEKALFQIRSYIINNPYRWDARETERNYELRDSS